MLASWQATHPPWQYSLALTPHLSIRQVHHPHHIAYDLESSPGVGEKLGLCLWSEVPALLKSSYAYLWLVWPGSRPLPLLYLATTYLVNLGSYLGTYLPAYLPNIIDEDEELFHSGQWVAPSLSSRLPDFLLSASDVALAMEPTHF